MGVPCGRDVPCGQPACRTGAAKAVGALVAHGAVDGVAAHVAVGGSAEERGLAAVAVGHRVVDGVLLAGLLEVLVVVGAEPALSEVHAHLVVVAAGAVDVVHLHTAVGIHDVGVVEHVVVAGRGAEVPRVHLVERLAHETALVDHRLGQRVDHVGVGVEPRVGVAHRGVVHHAEGHGLVAALLDELLLRGGGVLVGSDGAQLNGAHGLVLQLGLELGVEHVELHVVVGQLVVDVEGSIVAHVELVGVERTRAVDGVGVGVDVEVASHGAAHHVDALVRRTGSLLLAVGRVADEVQRHALVQVVVGVDVGRIAAHLAALGPARVAHHRERGIVLGLVCTGRHRHGVVVRDGVGEQLVKPVGVAHFGTAKIVNHSLLSVGQSIAVVFVTIEGGIIVVHQVIHLAVDTARRCTVARHERQETVVLHLTEHRHLLLRVHDVELRVAGLQAHGILARVADARRAGLTTLGGHDNHTGHCARTIYRGGATILQNLERLDVVGVQTGDGTRYQRSGVTA